MHLSIYKTNPYQSGQTQELENANSIGLNGTQNTFWEGGGGAKSAEDDDYSERGVL
jgi:hypothetical protein